MKAPLILLLAAFCIGLNSGVSAAETLQSSRSAGKFKRDQNIDLSQRLQTVVKQRRAEAENYTASGAAARDAGIANRHDQLFEIFEADVDLLADDDGDGYHHALNVFFDVDVSHDSAVVYAKLYLSRDGEPWSQYFTTDLFTIHDNLHADAYEVETELLDGYPEGYYEVLIEVYSLDHVFMVASEVLDFHYLGKDILLEDLHRDEPYDGYHGEVSVSVGGAAGMGGLLLFFLLVQVVIAARGFLASALCKKSEIIKIMNPLRCDPFFRFNRGGCHRAG